MKEAKLLGTLLPSHPDLIPILSDIRDKYNLPIIDQEDDALKEIILADQDIDLEAIQKEIEEKVKSLPELLPAKLSDLYQKYKSMDKEKALKDAEQSEVPEPLKGQIISVFDTLYDDFLTPIISRLDDFYLTISHNLFIFLVTGETVEVPMDWLGGVFSIGVFGTPLVIAMAGPASDPQEIKHQFMSEYHRVFGKYHPKIKESHIKSADYLRMKLSGMPLKDIADVYMQRHPSQFPDPSNRKAYMQAKRKCEEMLKKRIQRIDKTYGQILGDSS